MTAPAGKGHSFAAISESWPLLPGERAWSGRSLTVVLLVAACANWCYIIGEYLSHYLDLRSGFAALTAGTLLGALLVILATVPVSSRFGVDSIVGARPQLGTRGWLLTLPLQYVSIAGWNALVLIFCGKSIAEFLRQTGLLAESGSALVVPLTTIAVSAVIVVALRAGIGGVQSIANWLFVVILALGLWIAGSLVVGHGGALLAARPAGAPDSHWSYVTGIELGIASVLSWWPYVGAMIRLAPDARSAVAPLIYGLALPVPLLSTVGLAASLVTGLGDPAQWMTAIGGPVQGVVALVFLIVTNIGTALVGIYAAAVGLRSVEPLRHLSWTSLVMLAIAPVTFVGVVMPELFYANLGSFLAILGVLFAPLCGLQIADTFLLRRGRIDVRALYASGPEGAYWFWGGINPAAVLAMAAGVATYVYLLHPVTYASHWPYEWATASLPAAAISALVYVPASIALNRSRGRGGY